MSASGPDDPPDAGVARIAGLLRAVPDYPSAGVTFWDLTRLFADRDGFTTTIDLLAAAADGADVVVGIEARGFLLGAAVARALGLGVVPVRKAGKLPLVAAALSYDLEYGSATLELPAGVLGEGTRAFLVDDVLATGGTAAAAASLVRTAGARVTGLAVVLELAALGGRARLDGRPVHVLLSR